MRRKLTVISTLIAFLLIFTCVPATMEPPDDTGVPTSTPTFTPVRRPSIAPSPSPPSIAWTSLDPGGGGGMPAVAISSTGTIYVSSDVGGMYRSTDDGQTWQNINDGLEIYSVNEIAIHPTNPSTIYLGTLRGVYKSLDGGDHWELKRTGFPKFERWGSWETAPIASLTIDPNDRETIYVGIGDSHMHKYGQGIIYKSTNGGERWDQVNTGIPNIDREAIVYCLVIDPRESNVLYASTDRGVYKSTDGGVSWTIKEQGLPLNDARYLVMNPEDPNTLFVTLHTPPNQYPWRGGVYRSLDGGETWEPKTNGLGKYVGKPGDSDNLTTNYDHILIDNSNPDILYVGDVSWPEPIQNGVYKTTDGGESWSLTTWPTNVEMGWDRGNPYVDWDQGNSFDPNILAMDPSNPERIYFTDGRLIRTDDGGDTWYQIHTDETPPGSGFWHGRSLALMVVHDVDVDPMNSNRLYFSYWDHGPFRSEDGGYSFKRINRGIDFPSNMFSLVIDPAQPNVLYGSIGRWEDLSVGEVVKSEDHGDTWRVIGSGTSGLPESKVSSLVIDPSSPTDGRTVYAASYLYGVFKSTDGGGSWFEMNNGLGENGNRFVSSLIIDPSDPDILFAGVDMITEWLGHVQPDQHGGIYKTTNAGRSWEKIAEEMNSVVSLAIDPLRPRIIYAVALENHDDVNDRHFEGGLFKSVDSGQTWERAFSGPTLKVVAIDPQRPQNIYVGTVNAMHFDDNTGQGVFRSLDGGSTWEPVNDGLSHLSVNVITFDPHDPDILYAGTNGNGVFRGEIK